MPTISGFLMNNGISGFTEVTHPKKVAIIKKSSCACTIELDTSMKLCKSYNSLQIELILLCINIPSENNVARRSSVDHLRS